MYSYYIIIIGCDYADYDAMDQSSKKKTYTHTIRTTHTHTYT